MKKVFLVIVFLVLVFSLVLTASAHSGGTDHQGGHTDHSTGEYHWHHGYSAHQHTDMDGDGDLDCPYDFEDRTGESSGSSSYGVSNTSSPRPATTPRPTAAPKPTSTPVPEARKTSFFSDNAILIAVDACIVGGMAACAVIDAKRERKRKERKRPRNRK